MLLRRSLSIMERRTFLAESGLAIAARVVSGNFLGPQRPVASHPVSGMLQTIKGESHRLDLSALSAGEDAKPLLERAFAQLGSYRPGEMRELVVRGAGVASLSGNVDIPSGIRLVFEGNLRFVPSKNGIGGLRAYGNGPLSFQPLLADGVRGADALMANPMGISAGDYIWVQSDSLINESPNSKNIKIAQFAKVERVERKFIYLDRPLQYNFLLSDSAKISKIDVKRDIEIENFSFGGLGFPISGRGADFRFCDNISLKGFRFENSRKIASIGPQYDTFGGDGIMAYHTSNFLISDIDGNHLGWYLVDISGASHHGVVRNISAQLVRHCVDFNWNGPGEPIDVLVENVTADMTTFSGAGTHDVGRDIHFRGIRTSRSWADGFQIRTSNLTLEDYVGHNHGTNGLVIRAEAIEGQAKLVNIKLRKINVTDNGSRGILSQAKIDLKNFSCCRNGGARARQNWGGIHTSGGYIEDGSILDNKECAIQYIPFNLNEKNISPIFLKNIYAPSSNNQVRFIESYNEFSKKNIHLENCEIYGYYKSSVMKKMDMI